MTILTTTGWEDYALLDSGDGKRYERFGSYRIVRPDPQCIWSPTLSTTEWEKADAIFSQKPDGKEGWVRNTDVPEKWLMKYKDISFYAKLSPFKHTGVFPEQHLMWDFVSDKIAKGKGQRAKSAVILNDNEGSSPGDSSSRDQVNILNLFAYTGIASLVCAAAGAKVTHVDASHPTIGWARENQALSDLSEKPIRWILDDCTKFVAREVKRGIKYDGIIMDPPVFGHGPDGQRWEFFESFPRLISDCQKILSEKPLFMIINAYAISASSIMLENVLTDTMKNYNGSIDSGELALTEQTSGRLLSTGIFARWNAS